MALHMHGVNTCILISFSGVSFSSVAAQLGGLTFLNLTLLIYKMGIILCYEGIMPCCISHAPHYIRLLHFNFCIYYKYTPPPSLAGNSASLSQGSLGQIYSPEVRTSNHQIWLWHCFLPLPSCPTQTFMGKPYFTGT